MSLLDGMSAFGWDRDNNVTTDATKNPLFTYQTIEMPVNTNKDNVELLKENGNLIGKYFKEFKDLFEKASKDEESKKLLDMDILNKLNEFAYARDKLFADIPMVSIPSIWTKDDLDENKTTITTTGNVELGEIYEVPDNIAGKKLKNPRDFAEEQKEKLANLDGRKLNNDDSSNHIEPIKESDKFDRSLSLTYGEVERGNKWFEDHQKKYHKKRLDFLRKNPFAGGASPVADCYWKWFACSIGTSCDIVCTECEKKYIEAKKKHEAAVEAINKLINAGKTYKDPEVKVAKKLVNAAAKEKDKLYKQAYFELRGLDE